MTSKQKRILLILITAFVALYTYAWFYAAKIIEDSLLTEVDYLRSKSITIDHGPISVHGYPFHIDIQVDGLYIKFKGDSGLSASIEGPLHGTGSLFNPWKLHLFSNTPLRITEGSKNHEVQSGIHVIDAKKTNLILHLSKHDSVSEINAPDEANHSGQMNSGLPNGLPQNIELFLQDVRLPLLKASCHQISVKLERNKIDPFLSRYLLDLDHLKFDTRPIPSLPETISHAHLEISLKGRASIDLPIDQFVNAWYETEGFAEIKTMIVEWGTIKLVGNGSLSLDESLQPIASFSTEVTGIQELLDVLIRQDLMNKTLKPIVMMALSPYQEKRTNLAGTSTEVYHKIGLSVQSNGVENEFIVSTIPVFAFPHIDWRLFGTRVNGSSAVSTTATSKLDTE